ncbi:MAG: putative photosynthetic complex assembly protein PuhE [Pseudomonadota bacterium]
MSIFGPVLFTIAVWYFSTGAVLWLARGTRERVPHRLLGVTVLAAIGFAGALISAHHGAAWVPYLAMASAVSIWAWAEFTFLTGLLTGPRRSPCPPDISEAHRFILAFRTISRHEYGLLIALAALALVAYTGQNAHAFAIFTTLWVMRISAKLVLFNGAPGFSSDMMPSPILYMTTYFRHDRIGPVFWIATLTLTATVAMAITALMMGWIDTDQNTIAVMLISFVGLATFEHWMMVLPWRDSALWNWALNRQT